MEEVLIYRESMILIHFPRSFHRSSARHESWRKQKIKTVTPMSRGWIEQGRGRRKSEQEVGASINDSNS